MKTSTAFKVDNKDTRVMSKYILLCFVCICVIFEHEKHTNLLGFY